jgi:diguanylate cyclase (GGDEF)-like protein/putative nucleotidyltransferase with HDIG domain
LAQESLLNGQRTPGLPDRARVFLGAIGIAAVVVSAAAIAHGGKTDRWLAFGVLLGAASVAQLFAFHTIRNQVFHTTPLFLVAGAMLLPPQLLVLVPLVAHIPDWIRKRYAWYIQTFNILNFTLAIMSAWGVARLVDNLASGADGAWAIGAAAGAATYVILNNAGFAVILYLARGHDPREILHPQILAADASLACLGIMLATFWESNAWLVPFALIPVFLLHAALHLPQLREEARVDAKTDLANRRHFMESLTEELTRARRFGRPLSVISADIDLLSSVNATYGYFAGDAVLAGVADMLRTHVREYDVGARIGGGKFAIMLPETTGREAWETAERIRETVAQTPIWAESAGEYVSATLSIGVASFPEHGTDPDDLLGHADFAAHRARLQGRNRVMRASKRAALTALAPEPFLAVLAPDDARMPDAAHPDGPPALLRGSHVPVVALTAVGVVAGALAAAFGHAHDVAGLLVIAALVLVGQTLALATERGSISVGNVAALAGAATFGLRAALLMAVATVLGDAVVRRPRRLELALTLGIGTLALLVAAVIFDLTPGGEARDLIRLALGPVGGLAALLTAAALRGLVTATEGRESWWRVARDDAAWLAPHYAAYGLVAAATALAYRGAGLYAFAVLGVSLLAIRKTQEAVVAQARRNAQQLRHAAELIQTQTVSLQQVNRLLRQRSTSALETLAGIIDMHDANTAGHSRRVRDLALAMGRELGLAEAELDVLGRAALFHDLGKLAIPEAVLLKPGPLSDDEWELVRRHPDEGARIIERLGFLDDAVPAIRHHHERVDGSGYPRGLAGDEIPLEARLIHVADAYDSMRTNRIYREARTAADAVAELRRAAGQQFDVRCVDSLERVLADGALRGEAAAEHGREAAS